ncbi:hypothetical protein ACFJIY_07730 [Pimelobacter simplex]|uniref:hypothetical protein n=1 Tax=Nocardioides simplex TaxID=2045 RepID=UPI0036717A6B
MTEPICAWCKQPAKGLATIGDDHYCHEGDSPTCYESAQTFLALSAGQMSRAGSFLDGLLGEQHRQREERHGDPTFAGAQALERLNEDRRRDTQALQAAHALAQEWIGDDAEPATDHGVTAQVIRNACGQQLLVALSHGAGDQIEMRIEICKEAVRNALNDAADACDHDAEDGHCGSATCAANNRITAAWLRARADSDETVLAIARATSVRWREALDLLADAEQAEHDDGRLREEEYEALFDALEEFATNSPEAHPGVPPMGNLLAAVVPVVERILADHVRSAESTRERAMHSRAEWRRRAEEAEREYECDLNTANLAVEVAEQQRDFATATAADAVAKLDRLHDLLAEPAESRAGLLAQRMIRDALAGKR